MKNHFGDFRISGRASVRDGFDYGVDKFKTLSEGMRKEMKDNAYETSKSQAVINMVLFPPDLV